MPDSKNEPERIGAEPVERVDADAFQHERNERGIFTPDVIRDPTEERTR